MKLIKVHNNRQSFYELGFTIKAPNEITTDHIRDEWEVDDDLTTVSIVCISDAKTHFERLVFPAFYVKNKITGVRKLAYDMLQIAGDMTMMIHGGDPRTFKEPEEYSKEIWDNYEVLSC
jgi:hypothetical protein